MKKILTLAIILFLNWNQSYATGIAKSFDTAGLTQKEQNTLYKLAANIDQILPQKIKDEVANRIRIKFQTLNDTTIPTPHCEAVSEEDASKLSKIKYGTFHSSGKNIIIARQLLSQYEDGEKHTYPCRHGNLRKRLQGVVLHEIFHAYDKKGKFKRQEDVKGCPSFNGPLNANRLSWKCRVLYKQSMKKRRVSGDMVFQGQSFWRNDKRNIRVPDPYENHNKEEYAAVNFEYFILDKEYQCRRPMQYHFFNRHLSHTPFPNTQCSSTSKVLVSGLRAKKTFVPIDLDRVYQVQYLYAEKGSDIAAGFGHSLIRLVICAPERQNPRTKKIIPATPYGPECLNDINYHLVASFYADILDLNRSTAKGLFGGYDSVLGMISLTSVIKKYNRIQMRSMYALPLQYTEAQKQLFLKNMLNIHWEYRGNYKFITNNCATETLQLLISPFDKAEHHVALEITPGGIKQRLIELNLIDEYHIQDDYQNLNSLNIMKSNAHYLKIAYKNIFPKFIEEITTGTIKKYIATKAAKRRKILERLNNDGSEKKWEKTIKSFILLERQAERYFESDFWDYFLKEVVELIKSGQLPFDLDQIAQARKDIIPLTGYGIPQSKEWSTLQNKFKSGGEADFIKTLLEDHKNLLKPYLEQYQAEQQAINDNMERANQLLQLSL